MTRERITHPRQGTVERRLSSIEITTRWFAVNAADIIRDLQMQIDALAGLPNDTLTRERLRQLDDLLKGAT